jgi:tetratricopeptide (TPR) repeat protein
MAEITGPALLLDEPPQEFRDHWTLPDPAQLTLVLPAGPLAQVETASRTAWPEAPDGVPWPATDRAGPAPLGWAAVSFPAAAALPAPVPEAEPSPPTEAAPTVPDPLEELFHRAREAADAGALQEAMQLYTRLIAAQPKHLMAHCDLARLLAATGDADGALAALDRGVGYAPDEPALLTERGALLGAVRRYGAAEADLKRVLRMEPGNVDALFHLGVVMSKKGLWAEAVPSLRRAIELDPAREVAYCYLGEALNHVDDLPGALSAFERAVQLQPGSARALYGLGIVYDRLARPEEAAQMYRRSREVGRR